MFELKNLDGDTVLDCAILNEACYSRAPFDFLEDKRHRFTSLFASFHEASEGHYLIAERADADSTVTYLCVRGSYNLEDWKVNFKAWPTFSKFGMVHSGWYNRSALLPKHYLRDLLLKGQKVVITGHSLGGAVSLLLSFDLLEEIKYEPRELRSNFKCITFGAPLVINQFGARFINNSFKGNFINFIVEEDLVPKILSWAQDAVLSVSKDIEGANGGWLGSIWSNIECKCTFVQNVIEFSDSLVELRYTGTLSASLTALNNASNELLGSDFMKDLVNYAPAGNFLLLSSENLSPLSEQGILSSLKSSSFKITATSVVAHNIANYCSFTLQNIPIGSTFNKSRPGVMRMPEASITSITLKSEPGDDEMLVSINGENLYEIKALSMVNQICNADRLVLNGSNSQIMAHRLTFATKKLPQVDSSSPGQMYFSKLSCESHFGRDIPVIDQVRTSVDKGSPFDVCTLQELLASAYSLLLLSSKQVNKLESTDFKHLRFLIQEVLRNVPATLFINCSSPIANLCLRNEVQVKKMMSWNDKFIREFYEEMKSQYDERKLTSFINDYSALHSVLNDPEQRSLEYRRNPLNAWELILLAIPHDSNQFDNFLAELYKPFECAQNILLSESSEGQIVQQGIEATKPENMHLNYLNQLVIALSTIESVCRPIGLFYHLKQTNLGPINSLLVDLFSIPLVRAIILFSSKMAFTLGFQGIWPLMWAGVGALLFAGGGYGALALYGAYSIAFGMFGRAVYFTAIQWPSSVTDSSSGLIKFILETGLHRPLNGSDSVGIQENTFARELWRVQLHAIDYRSNFEAISRFVEHYFPNYIEPENYEDTHRIKHRIKLALLSNELRSVLKRLPIVVLKGMTEAGKSTLKEMLRDPGNPDESKFGGRTENRTTVPEVVIGGRSDFPFCILDTVGVGDQTITNPELLKALEKTNKIWATLAGATIIVCDQKEDRSNTLAITQAMETSRLNPNRDLHEHCILTCFNKADTIFPPYKLPKSCENFWNGLKAEATRRESQGRPYDMRTINQNPNFPRVFSCFDPNVIAHLPNDIAEITERDRIIITHEGVRQWLEEIFYPSTKV